MKSFAGVLRELKAERQISNQDIADMLFVPVDIINQWVEGKGVPDKQKLERLATWYGLDYNMMVRSTKVKSLPIVSPNVKKVNAPEPLPQSNTKNPSISKVNPVPSSSPRPQVSQPYQKTETVSTSLPPSGKSVAEKAYTQIRHTGIGVVATFFLTIVTIASPISLIGFVTLGLFVFLTVNLVRGMRMPDQPIRITNDAIIFIYSDEKHDVIPLKDVVSITPKMSSNDSGFQTYGKIYVSTPEKEFVMPFIANCTDTVKTLREHVEHYQTRAHS